MCQIQSYIRKLHESVTASISLNLFLILIPRRGEESLIPAGWQIVQCTLNSPHNGNNLHTYTLHMIGINKIQNHRDTTSNAALFLGSLMCQTLYLRDKEGFDQTTPDSCPRKFWTNMYVTKYVNTLILQWQPNPRHERARGRESHHECD